MPGYVQKALHKFQQPHPKQLQFAPHEWTEPAYSQRIQYASRLEDLPLLNCKSAIRVQSNSKFLYYARAVAPTMLTALNEISQQQSKLTAAATLKNVNG